MENRTFSDVPLSDAQYDAFSDNIKQMVMVEKDVRILTSIQYTKPGAGKGLDSLSRDEKLLNGIFVDECHATWNTATDELNERVYEFIAREKMKIDFTTKPKSDSSLAYDCLFALSMPRLRAWQEDDDDEATKVAKKEKSSSEHKNNSEFESWVKYKDRYVV